MLKTRIITASILLLVFFSALFYLPPPGWAAFSTLIAALSVWEWGGLMRTRRTVRLLLVLGLLFFCASLAVFFPGALGLTSGFHQQAWTLGRWFYIPALILWIVVVPLWMHFRWDMTTLSIGILVGAVLILPTWLALVQLRSAGSVFLLGIMACVWIADTGAYLFGRLFGKHKLAPSISPGKTWEGALGGGLMVILYGIIVSLNSPEFPVKNHLVLVSVLAAVAVISVVGDLFESLLKRLAGLKDSSSMLPGHGGVLDRIDSLTSTLPLVALVWFYLGY